MPGPGLFFSMTGLPIANGWREGPIENDYSLFPLKKHASPGKRTQSWRNSRNLPSAHPGHVPELPGNLFEVGLRAHARWRCQARLGVNRGRYPQRQLRPGLHAEVQPAGKKSLQDLQVGGFQALDSASRVFRGAPLRPGLGRLFPGFGEDACGKSARARP
jgi:hypothetical protein